MEYGTEINFTYSELKALFKSIGIGCEQVMKKLDRLSTTKYHDEVRQELEMLMSVHDKVSKAMMTIAKEVQT